MSKEIIILSGIPCSGKSSWARIYAEIYFYKIVSRDRIRERMAGGDYVYNKNNESKVTKLFNDIFNELVELEYDIILDNTHVKEAYIKEWIDRRPKDYTIRVIFFYVPLWKAYYRNIVRYVFTGKWIPFKVIKDMKKSFDKIDKRKYESLYL